MKILSLIGEQLSTQFERYYRTRYGKIVAILIYYLIFTLVPKALNYVIPWLTTYFSPQHTYVILMSGSLTFITILFFASMYFVYTSKIEFFQQYRVNKNKPWPWEQDPEKWRKLLWSSIKQTLFFMWVITPILVIISVKLEFYIVMDMSLTPSFLSIIPQLLIMLFLQDLIFFTTHWAFHQPFLYKFHKVHHEYTTTIVTAGLYSHLVQFLLSNSISAGLYMKAASLYAPLHISTAIIWTILRMYDGYNGHSGYMFSWAPLQLIPFCTNDDFHDFHHSQNYGNYGSQLRYLDTIFGTCKAFKDYKKSLKEKQKVK